MTGHDVRDFYLLIVQSNGIHKFIFFISHINALGNINEPSCVIGVMRMFCRCCRFASSGQIDNYTKNKNNKKR